MEILWLRGYKLFLPSLVILSALFRIFLMINTTKAIITTQTNRIATNAPPTAPPTTPPPPLGLVSLTCELATEVEVLSEVPSVSEFGGSGACVLAVSDGPAVLAVSDDPTVLAISDDPAVLAISDDPAVLAISDDPAVLAISDGLAVLVVSTGSVQCYIIPLTDAIKRLPSLLSSIIQYNFRLYNYYSPTHVYRSGEGHYI